MRQPIDRSRFTTEEFKEHLRKAAEEEANDPEYLAEIALWDVCVGDGLEEERNDERFGSSGWGEPLDA